MTCFIVVVDALGKLPAGVMRGNLNLIGSYDECANIKAKIQNSTAFGGRYCKSRVGAPGGLMNMVLLNYLMYK